MRPWVRRKIWLAVLAFANLVVWGAAAYSVSLVASDRLDLGIESSVREVQTTAIAAWNASRPGASASGAGSTGGDISGPQAQPDGSVLPAGQAALVPRPATPLPQATTAAAEAGEALPVESAAALSPESIALEPGSALAPGATGASAASTAPITTPLILADPPFHDLTALDRELATSAAGRTVQIRYLEASLQKEVGLLLEGRSDLPYQNVQLELRGGQLVVLGDLVLLGVPLHAQVKGTLVASDCRPSVAVSSVKIGWLFTPVVVRNQVESLIGQVLEWYPEGYPLCIDRIVTQEDRVTLYGHRR
ncbi:MAG TPA: hypothetical protein PKO09_00900 [Anaerolineae bacterium]|nr:hypothetical protein [Anaerolineae bacterium]